MPDSNTLAIGAALFNTYRGKVRVYKWTGSNWIQKGTDLVGDASFDAFGSSVEMPDSNHLAIGAWGNDSKATDAGMVRIFEWSGSAWLQKGNDIQGDSAGDNFGHRFSMPDTNTIGVGAYKNSINGDESGQTQIFDWSGTAWIQRGQDIYGVAMFDRSGIAVSMPNDNVIAIGANLNDGNGTDAGHVRVFEWDSSAWVQNGLAIEGEAANDWSGWSLTMPESNILAIGAYRNDGNGPNSGHTRIYRDGISTSLDNNLLNNEVIIYPNPSNGQLSIELNEYSTLPLQIFDLSGKIVQEFQLSSRRNNLDLTDLAEGIYFVRYGEFTQKLIITR